MTNFEKIKNMSVEELANFICGLTYCDYCPICCRGGCEHSWERWLESEAEDND
jgi:hypothetical protein